MEQLFVDTSAWCAHVNRAHPSHRRVAGLLASFEGRLVTTNFVFDETVTLLRRRRDHATACLVGEHLLDLEVTDLMCVSPKDEREAWQLFRERGDKLYSFTDCTSFVLMKRLGIRKAASLDQDFAREGFESLPV